MQFITKGYIALLHVVVIVLLWLTISKTWNMQNIVVMSDGDALNWTVAVAPQHLQNLIQDSRELVEYIRRDWLVAPFEEGSLTIKTPNKLHYSQRGQSEFVDNLLNHKKHGFFIEAGAADGEMLSNSLFFEKSRNWTGLLVEANTGYFKRLLTKHRHAHMINACLSPNNYSTVLNFRTADLIGGLTGFMEDAHKVRIMRENGKQPPVRIQCFPIGSILLALNVTHVDYFSLDIEGAEVDVLKTFPFEKITVGVFGIEYQIGGDSTASKQKANDIKKILVDKHGYKVVRLDSTEDIILTKL